MGSHGAQCCAIWLRCASWCPGTARVLLAPTKSSSCSPAFVPTPTRRQAPAVAHLGQVRRELTPPPLPLAHTQATRGRHHNPHANGASLPNRRGPKSPPDVFHVPPELRLRRTPSMRSYGHAGAGPVHSGPADHAAGSGALAGVPPGSATRLTETERAVVAGANVRAWVPPVQSHLPTSTVRNAAELAWAW